MIGMNDTNDMDGINGMHMMVRLPSGRDMWRFDNAAPAVKDPSRHICDCFSVHGMLLCYDGPYCARCMYIAKLLLRIVFLFDLKWMSRALYADPQLNKIQVAW